MNPLAGFAVAAAAVALTVAVVAANDPTDRPAGAEATLTAITAPASAHMPAQPVVERTTVPVTEPATTLPAIVAGPGGTAIDGRCTQYEPLLAEYAPAGDWDVARMSGYLWRESRCTPTARSRTSDSGLSQINDINHPYLRTALGEWVDRYTLLDPVQNIRAAAALCSYWRNAGASCYQPWRTT